MQRSQPFIRSATGILMWAFIALDTLMAFLLIAITAPFDQNQRLTYHIANLWGELIVKIKPFWKVKISCRRQIQRNKAYVLVANHSSLADIVCLYCLKTNFKWLAKKSLFKIPFFGWAMSLLNYIPLERGKHGSIRDSFSKAEEWLNKNVSVLIFPEGTRSRSGALGEFKSGAFKLALRTKKPILPIVIYGTHDAMSPGKATMETKVTTLVKVLPEIAVDAYQEDESESLKTKVWNLMSEELTCVPGGRSQMSARPYGT